MGSYYYVKDKDSEFGFTPVPEEEFTKALLLIIEKHGMKLTNEMILHEINEMEKELT